MLLSSCELIERPSKKMGFCFKLYHPLDQGIWASRVSPISLQRASFYYIALQGPRGESFGAVTQPIPNNYIICRADTSESGRCWMDALELALKCSGLLVRSMHKVRNCVFGKKSLLLLSVKRVERIECGSSGDTYKWRHVDGQLARAHCRYGLRRCATRAID